MGIPTGSLLLDHYLGGYPEGFITEISGEPGVGKTFLMLQALRDTLGCLITPNRFDTRWLQNQQLDVNNIEIFYSPFIEDVKGALLSTTHSLILIDDLALFSSRREKKRWEIFWDLCEFLTALSLWKRRTVLITNQLRFSGRHNGIVSASETIIQRFSQSRIFLEKQKDLLVQILAFPHPLSRYQLKIPLLDGRLFPGAEKLQLGLDLSLVEQKGRWYFWDGQRFGPGFLQAAKQFGARDLNIFEGGEDENARNPFPTL